MLLKKWREILSRYSKAWAILGKLVQAFGQLQRTLFLYGEASQFIITLEKYKLTNGVAIRSNHGAWMSS